MLKYVIGSILLSCLLAFPQVGQPQSHNTGYYVKVYEDATKAVWQLQWSEYFESVQTEPFVPGDFQVPISGGGYCDPDTGICYDPLSLGFTPKLSSEDPYEGDPMIVTPPKNYISSLFIMLGGPIMCSAPQEPNRMASSPGLQCTGGSGHARPDPDPCNTDGWSDISEHHIQMIFKNPSLKRELENLLASSISQQKEKMAILIPLQSGRPGAYSFNVVGTDIGTLHSATACNMHVSLPVLPPGSMIVHTHPFGMNDPTCDGGFYVPGPSEADWDNLDETIGADTGIILDKDSITTFKRDSSGSEDVDAESSCL